MKTFNDYRAALTGVGPATKERILAEADKLGISLRYYQQIEAGDRTGDFAIWDDLEDITGIHQRILRETNLGKASSL